MQNGGLSAHEAAKRLKEFGPNETKAEFPSVATLIARQIMTPLALMLVAAAALSFVVGETVDAAVILMIFGINATLSFLQEFHAEATTKRLTRRLAPLVDVIRNGAATVVSARDIVPGDVILLEAGDIIPADAKILESIDALIDESLLTGESAPVQKSTNEKIFSGTSMLQGTATALVEHTGKQTKAAEILTLSNESEAPSSFELVIAKLSSTIAKITGAALVFIFIAQLFLRPTLGLDDRLLFFVALAILMIPEALPVVVTLTFGRGAMMLAKKSVLVRRLSAIEELGHVQVLCVDKTGTLTEGSMHVSSVEGDGEALANFIMPTIGHRVPHTVSGMAYDRALQEYYAERSIHTRKTASVLAVVPFDPTRRRSSRLVRIGDKNFLVVQGAPEAMFDVSADLSKDARATWLEKYRAMGDAGERTLAFAIREIAHTKVSAEDEQNLQFLGIVGFSDPLRKSAQKAIQDAQHLNVEIKILTGDSVEVALAIARKAGLIQKNDRAVTGEQFTKASHEEKRMLVRETHVFARISPHDKYQIVKLLEAEGKRVAFMGDGMNDAPALRAAHVGLAVSTAADISKAAADIVLLKSDLHVIIQAIRAGRDMFANVQKFLYATLVGNFGNFLTVALLSLVIPFLPLLPVQILILNFLTDFPMVAVASDTNDADAQQKPRQFSIREVVMVTVILGAISSIFDFASFAIFQALSPDRVRTLWFMVSTFTELALIFSIRSWHPIWRAKAPSLPLMVGIVVAAAIAGILPFTPLGQNAFHFSAPTAQEFSLIIALAASYLVVTEIAKLTLKKKLKQGILP